MPRPRRKDNQALSNYPGLGRYPDGRYYFQNPFTKRQASLKTRDLKKAIALWALSKAICDKAYGKSDTDQIIDKVRESNTPVSKGGHIHLRDFIKQWRTEMLEQGKVTIKIKRDQGKPIAKRTRDDYVKNCKQLEALEESRFSISSPDILKKIRILLSPWITKPTTYNHIKSVLGRVFDHAVVTGHIDRNPMIDIDKLAVSKREVLIPDKAYIEITDQLAVHQNNRQQHDGTWRIVICDLIYMLSQQPIDFFSIKVSQINLDAIDKSDPDKENWIWGEIDLSRHKTSVAGIIGMNREMREKVEWLLKFREDQLRLSGNVFRKPEHDNLLIYPMYMAKRYRLRPVTHRTFSGWWAEASEKAGYKKPGEKGQYWIMDMRKKGLTDEFVNQGDNDKGLHATEAMKAHYRLINPPKRSRNTLVSIRDKKAG